MIPVSLALRAAGATTVVTSVDALDEALDEYHAAAATRRRPLTIILTRPGEPDAMMMTVGADQAAITWTSHTALDQPGRTVISTNGGTDDEPTTEVDYADTVSVLPAWAFIPAEVARAAARVFAHTGGQRPETPHLNWVNY